MATIIFDLDGTIADSFDYITDFLANEKNQQKLDPVQKEQLKGMSMLAIARKLNHRWWGMPMLFLRGRRNMEVTMNKMQPFAGMPELIRKVHAEGHELFIVSSNSVKNIHKFLHHHHLHTYFLEVYGGVSIFGKAPALRQLFKEQNIEAKDAIYVGDELRDIQACKSVGLRIVAVSWGFANKHELENLKPTAIVDSPNDLMSYLEEI